MVKRTWRPSTHRPHETGCFRCSPSRGQTAVKRIAAADKAYADKIWYWTTPISQCLDDRTNTTCTDYGDWTQAWTEIKG